MVAFCFGLDGLAWVSADGVSATSGASRAAEVGSGDDVGASGVAVRPSDRGVRPETADADLSRAMAFGIRDCSLEGIDWDDSVEDA